MDNYVIQEWDASRYCWESKLWKYGKLALCSSYVCFFEGSDSEPSVAVDLRRVTGFQRRQVSLIYKAIVVGVEGEKPLWLSSLKDREEVFYFLQHFWKERLLWFGGDQKGSASSSQTTSSPARRAERQRIFEVLYDAEKTLVEASDSLLGQGEQLAQSSWTMNKMHRDLNVAETLVNGLDRWFTKWDIKPEYFYEIKLKKEYPILYRKTAKESFFSGTLVISEGQVTVLNMKRVADVSMLLKDLTSIVVNTPWNIILVRSSIGEPDVMVDISSAQVVYVLKLLQQEYGDKFHYEDCSLGARRTVKISGIPQVPPVSTGSQARQQEQHGGRISDASNVDLETVSHVLSNMKAMAVGIDQEMTRQLDSLDQLSASVDKANYRIKKENKKVQEKL